MSRLDFFEGRSERLPLSDLRLPALPLFTERPERDDGGGTDNADVGMKDDAGGDGNDGGIDDNGGGTDANRGTKDEDTGPGDGKVDDIDGPGMKDNPADGGVKEGGTVDDVKVRIDD